MAMIRVKKPSTSKSGALWTQEIINQVWRKGKIVVNQNPALIRADACNWTMYFAQYRNRQSNYGWEVDHIDPNGSDDISNLQPLNWNNNAAKSDKTNWKCGQ